MTPVLQGEGGRGMGIDVCGDTLQDAGRMRIRLHEMGRAAHALHRNIWPFGGIHGFAAPP